MSSCIECSEQPLACCKHSRNVYSFQPGPSSVLPTPLQKVSARCLLPLSSCPFSQPPTPPSPLPKPPDLRGVAQRPRHAQAAPWPTISTDTLGARGLVFQGPLVVAGGDSDDGWVWRAGGWGVTTDGAAGVEAGITHCSPASAHLAPPSRFPSEDRASWDKQKVKDTGIWWEPSEESRDADLEGQRGWAGRKEGLGGRRRP